MCDVEGTETVKVDLVSDESLLAVSWNVCLDSSGLCCAGSDDEEVVAV